MTTLTEHQILSRTRAPDLGAVNKLNLWGNDLKDLSIVKRMPNVRVLSLSVNRIEDLESFGYATELRELYVRKNNISDLGQIAHLRRCPHLSVLWMSDNPCTEHRNYRLTVIRTLPQLTKLDNVPVTAEERAKASFEGEDIDDAEDRSATRADEFYAERGRSPSPHRGGGGGGGGGNLSPRTGWQKNETLVKRKIRDAAMEDTFAPTSPAAGAKAEAAAPFHFSPASGALRNSGGISREDAAAVVRATTPARGAALDVNEILEKYSPSKRSAAASPYRSPAPRPAAAASPSAAAAPSPSPPRRTDNILFAVLKLLEELDTDSLEVVHTCVVKKLASS